MNLRIEFVLASESPRRKQLLEEAGFHITVFPIQVSENLGKNLTVQAQIQSISTRKWTTAFRQWNQTKDRDALLLTADTMVVRDGQPLGKPADSFDAIETLLSLSNRSHEVITALTLGRTSSPHPVEAWVQTQVIFRPISRLEAESYVASGEPLDKAGSYAIQGEGRKFVERFEGDFKNVVGLPVFKIKEILYQQFAELIVGK